MREAIEESGISFEVTIERLCEKYHKLPSEILNEEMEWILILLEINKMDFNKARGEVSKDYLSKRVKERAWHLQTKR